MLYPDVVSQNSHSRCFIFALWAGKCCPLVLAFDMTWKNMLDREWFFTEVALESDSFMFCLLVPPQMTRLCWLIRTLVTREHKQLLNSMSTFHVCSKAASAATSSSSEVHLIAAELARQQSSFGWLFRPWRDLFDWQISLKDFHQRRFECVVDSDTFYLCRINVFPVTLSWQVFNRVSCFRLPRYPCQKICHF